MMQWIYYKLNLFKMYNSQMVCYKCPILNEIMIMEDYCYILSIFSLKKKNGNPRFIPFPREGL